MSRKIIIAACATIALTAWTANVFAQIYITPPLHTLPADQPPVQQLPVQQLPTQIQPAQIQQTPIQDGQVIPAAAILSSGQTVPSAQMIPAYPNQQPAPYTLSPTPAVRVPWSQALLKDVQTSHDFGSVPTGSQQEHTFEFLNTSTAALNLISVKASCGCTKPTVLTALVQPGETAQVMAKFETLKFRGEKAATVTVGINRMGDYSEYGEVQFSVKGKIRKDVVLTPGNITFANVPTNSESQQTVKMKYAGNPLWQILRVESTNPNIEAEAREIKRDGGRITYELVVNLSSSQTAGSFADELYVVTNDKLVNKMPITVSGRVKPTLEAAPIKLGVIKQGLTVQKRFVIRGQTPFSILSIEPTNDKIAFERPSGEKSLHVLTYTLDTSQPSNIEDTIRLVVAFADTPNEPQQKSISFSARVVAAK